MTNQLPSAGHYRDLIDRLNNATASSGIVDEGVLRNVLDDFAKGDPGDNARAGMIRPVIQRNPAEAAQMLLGSLMTRLQAAAQRATGGTRRIRRKAYTTRRGTHYKARMIADVGAPGKWRAEHRGAPGIGTLKEGDLAKVGYSVKAKTSTRRKAVDRAVKKYGKTSTIRKLNAVAVYTRRTSPAKSKVFKADMKYVQKNK